MDVADTVRILPLGDAALTVEFGDHIDPAINDRVHALHESLAREPLPGVIETVPTYRSLMVLYRPEESSWSAMTAALRRRLLSPDNAAEATWEIVEIPVLYGGKWGPDLGFVAAHAGLDKEAVIRIHSGAAYRIYMLGFSPGFPYLGGMDARIAVPRLKTPRTEIPAGSVGIAGAQTGVYPLSSPGGWRLIGRTPLRLYDPRRPNPILLRAGQSLRFRRIGRKEYDEIARKEAAHGDSG